MTKSNLGRKKDNSPKLTIIYDDRQNASVCKSIRLKEGVTKEEAIKESVKFLKEKL